MIVSMFPSGSTFFFLILRSLGLEPRSNGRFDHRTLVEDREQTFEFLFANADYPTAASKYDSCLHRDYPPSSPVLHTCNQVNRSRVSLAVDR